MQPDEKDEKIAHLEWALAVLTLKYQEEKSEATVILPARALGIFSVFDVKLTKDNNSDATVVHVKVRRQQVDAGGDVKHTEAITLDTSIAGRDLDYACLRACPSLDEYAPGYSNDDMWNRRYWYGSVPHYSTDHAAVRLLEDEIERRGLWQQYLGTLLDILNSYDHPSMVDIWAAIRATPEQRARAFLEVVRAK